MTEGFGTIIKDVRAVIFLAAVVFSSLVQAVSEVRLFEGTEARPSTDGRRLLFQRETPDGMRAGVYTFANRSVEWIDSRPGHSVYPDWGPDGSVVYTYGHEPSTAFEAKEGDTGYNLWVWKDGVRKQLTFGRERDYTPCFSPDGRTVYYATTARSSGGVRWNDPVRNATLLRTVSVSDGNAVVFRDVMSESSSGFVSPRVSPDGRLVIWAQIDRFFGTWHLAAASVKTPGAACAITPMTMSAYSPSWHPNGRHVAFTGFKPGDSGWGIYLTDAFSGAMNRVTCGRNPCFDATGSKLYYDRDGVIYERRISPEELPSGDVAEIRKACAEREATTFHVRMSVVYRRKKGLSHLFRGTVDGHPLAWQLFIGEDGTPEFATRAGADRHYFSVRVNRKLEDGSEHVLTGIRCGNSLYLSVDDDPPMEAVPATDCLMRAALPIRSEKAPDFAGEVRDFRLSAGWPPEITRSPSRAELFGEVVK